MTKEAIETFVRDYFTRKGIVGEFSVIPGNNPGHEVRVGSGTTMKSVTLDGFDQKKDSESLQEFLDGLTLD